MPKKSEDLSKEAFKEVLSLIDKTIAEYKKWTKDMFISFGKETNLKNKVFEAHTDATNKRLESIEKLLLAKQRFPHSKVLATWVGVGAFIGAFLNNILMKFGLTGFLEVLKVVI